MWEEFTRWLTDVTTNPAFISLISVLSVFGSVLVVVSKTSFGKKAIASLTDLSNGTKRIVEDTKIKVENKLEEVDNKINEFNESAINVKEELENKYKVFFNQFEFYETQMIEILSLIPNAKVQEKLEEIKAEWAEKKKEIQEIVGGSYNELENQLEELKKQLEEIKNGRIDNKTEEE